MKLKYIALTLCIALCLALVPAFATADNVAVPTGNWADYAVSSIAAGDGSEENPYIITTPEELAGVAVAFNSGIYPNPYSGKYFKLGNNLDLSAHRWTPIGNGSQLESFHSFNGYFAGDGKTVTGLYVDESENKYTAGLFGNFTNGTISNLIVKDAYVKTEANTNEDDEIYDSAGVIVGGAVEGYGGSIAITGCSASGTVESGSAITGGLVGYSSYANIADCSASTTVKGASNAGGFIGRAFLGSVSRCVANGDVSGSWCVGGFAGIAFYKTKIEKCASYGDVQASDWNVGGFIGFISQDVTISNCVSYSKVTTTLSLDRPIRTGGFIGTNNGSTIKNSHAAGTVSATQAGNVIGGFEGYDISGTTEKCSFDADKNTEMNAIGGTESAGTNDISTETTKKVMSNICVDYYGSHDYNTDEYVVDSQPDCTNDGSKSYHCRRCDSSDETSSVAIGKTGHSLKKTEKRDATCTEDGYEAYWTCENCEKIFSDEAAENEIENPTVINKTGHSLKKTEKKDATCTEDGYEAYWTCENCEKIFSDEAAENEIENPTVINKTGHSLKKTEKKDATCTEDGYEAYWTCENCEKTFSDEAAENEIENPTVINKTGHSLKKTEKKDATCTEDGYEAYWTCEKCERIFSDEAAENEITAPVVIPATGEESGGASSDNTPSDSSNTGSDNNGTSSSENSCESSSESGNSDQNTVPKTADGTDVALMLALVIISGLAFAAVLVVLRKRENA